MIDLQIFEANAFVSSFAANAFFNQIRIGAAENNFGGDSDNCFAQSGVVAFLVLAAGDQNDMLVTLRQGTQSGFGAGRTGIDRAVVVTNAIELANQFQTMLDTAE